MKHKALFFFLLTFAISGFSQNRRTTCVVDKKYHDFGTIKEGEAQQTVFTFTNTGSAPLIITNATSSCGCTVPDYPKNTPIAPGDSGQLTVNFNGTGMNKVTKTIRVEANTASGFENIKIEAFIEANN